MGYVYYGYYAMYYEVARVEALRRLGLTYREIEAMGVIMPVLENHSQFIAPAKYDELITIKTTVLQKPTVRIRFHYELKNEAKEVIHIGETLLAFVNQKSGKPCRPPEVMAKVLEPFFK
jgi:acyl-CoA thioester hydrolase